jgi:hypothetical protein
MCAEGVGGIDGGEVDDTRLVIRVFAILLLTRLMFLWLIQRLGFIGVETVLSRLSEWRFISFLGVGWDRSNDLFLVLSWGKNAILGAFSTEQSMGVWNWRDSFVVESRVDDKKFVL